MNRITLKFTKADGLPARLGMGPCDAEYLSVLNRSQEELLYAGRWFGTYRRMRICTTSNCITWPREVMTVEKLNICRNGVRVRNDWYEFQDFVAPPRTDLPDYCGGQLLERGWFPLFSDIVGTNKKLRFYPASATDVGKRILVQGLDGNGIPVRTLDAETGVYVDGEFVTLATPFAVTTSTYQHPLGGIQKPLTNDRVTVYEYDTTNLTERMVAEYQPSETNPSYRRQFYTGALCTSTINNEPDGCTTYPGCGRPLFEAMVRLSFIPLVADPDYLIIGNLGAVEDMARSLLQKGKDNYTEADKLRSEAIRQLRQWSDALSGGREKTIINMNEQDPDSVARVFEGFN